MSISKQDQIEHENKTWERALDFYKQENSYLKTRLSVVTDSRDDKAFLKLAEYFQNQFLLKDDFIKKLKRNIDQQNDKIKHNLLNSKPENNMLDSQEILRKEISYFETDFSRMKNEFNQLLTQYL